MKSLLHKNLALLVLMLASTGLTTLPAFAQRSTPRWSPRVESITVKAGALRTGAWH